MQFLAATDFYALCFPRRYFEANQIDESYKPIFQNWLTIFLVIVYNNKDTMSAHVIQIQDIGFRNKKFGKALLSLFKAPEILQQIVYNSTSTGDPHDN